jgi:hypothetical protein
MFPISYRRHRFPPAVIQHAAGRRALRTDRLSDSERAMLMGGACAKAYGWSPKKD